MRSEKEKVAPMKRVKLNISAGNRPASKELMDAESFVFIYGIGPEGLTPLERRLSGKTEGETVSLELRRSHASHFFGHVLPCPIVFQQLPHSFYINVKIKSIEKASPREIVSAMAQSTSCGNGCGCGCGDHG